MRKTLLLPLFAAAFILGCSTIKPIQMAYLGEDTAGENVSASVRHVDWYGLGVSGDDYIEGYEKP